MARLEKFLRILHRRPISETKTTVQYTASKGKPSAECVKAVVDTFKLRPDGKNALDKNLFYRKMQGFSKETLHATVQYLTSKEVMFENDTEVSINPQIWHCDRCINYNKGDGWHIRTTCMVGHSLRIKPSDMGRRCGSWQLTELKGMEN